MTTPTLVLWDIDQTLIDVPGITHDAYAAAFAGTTGRSLTESWQFDGRTELAAVTEVLRTHGLSPDGELVEAFMQRLVAQMHDRAASIAAGGRILPGAVEALDAVGRRPGVRQSVLTGNLYPLAELKLRLFGLDQHVDLRLGAYGGDAYERTDLPRHAWQRCATVLGHRFTGADTVIVGDTIRDVAAARACGARAVAVATGPYSVEQLEAAGADIVLPALSDTQTTLTAITAAQVTGEAAWRPAR